jgi:predicted small secreted protein
MRPNLIPLAALLLAACATPQGASRDVAEPSTAATPAAAPVPAPPRVDPAVSNANMNPTRYASGFPRAEFCEEEARRLRKMSPDTGWAVLKACVAQGRFTLLSRLIGGAWDKDLQSRPDASVLLARVVASRGGDLEGDLAAIRKQRVPLFGVGTSVLHPDLYKGRLVLFRAMLKEVKVGQGKAATARLAEYGLGGTSKYVDSDDKMVIRGSGSSSYADSGGYRGTAKGEGELQLLTQRRLTGNELAETGVEVVARMSEVDPFFEPGRQFVVLARFDGVRSEPGEDPEDTRRVAMVSMVAYFEPSHSVIE